MAPMKMPAVRRKSAGHDLLCRIGKKRGMLVSGGEIDTERAALTVLDEYRGGKLGRISLETPELRKEEQNDGQENQGS